MKAQRKKDKEENVDASLVAAQAPNLPTLLNTALEQFVKDYEDYEKSLRDALMNDKRQLDADLRLIDADLVQALSEKGVDAGRVKAIQDEIDRLDKQVKDIEVAFNL